MGQLFVFKYRHLNQTAFVIAYNKEYAGKLIEEVTNLPVALDGQESISDFPAAQEHYDRKGLSVWINNIDPF